MENGKVWGIGFDEGDFPVSRDFLDGIPEKVEYVDTTLDEGVVNPTFKPGRHYAGRPVKPGHIPTKVKWSSKRRPPYDFFALRGLILVSDAFKNIIERHEPGVHQFFPIDVVYKDGSHARQMYFFNICNRLDTMDRDRATAEFDGWYWDPGKGDFAFSKRLIGDRHAWVDKFVVHGNFLSDTVKFEMEKVGLTGIHFNEFPSF